MNAVSKVVGVVLAIIAMSALAAGTGEKMEQKAQAWPSFKAADTNSNGSVDTNEALSLRGFDFKAADKDKNGSLDKSEYETAMKEQSGKGMGKTGKKGS